VDIALILIIVVLLIGVLPTWPYSRNWGYYPSGALAAVLLAALVLSFFSNNRI
jgi:hypothetical protein